MFISQQLKRSRLVIAVSVFLVLFIISSGLLVIVSGADGDLDSTFANPGATSVPNGVARTFFGGDPDDNADELDTVLVQSLPAQQGKIVAAGRTLTFGPSVSRIALTRWNADGSPDTDFGVPATGGKVIVPAFSAGSQENAKDAALDTDDNIIIVGNTSSTVPCPTGLSNAQDWAIARYTADGEPDTGFGGGDGLLAVDFFGCSDDAVSVVGLSGGKFVVLGTAFDPGPQPINVANFKNYTVIAKFNADGTPDTSFGTANSGRVLIDDSVTKIGTTDLALIAGGVHAGKFVSGGSGAAGFLINRFMSTGELDTTFGNPDSGSAIANFGVAVPASAESIAIYPDGKILVGGTFNNADYALARFDSDGVLDNSFSTDGKVTTDIVESMLSNTDTGKHVGIMSDERIVMSGSSQGGPGGNKMSVARYMPNGDLDLGFSGDGFAVTNFGTNPDLGNAAHSVTPHSGALQTDGKILVGGTISTAFNSDVDFFVARFGDTAGPPVGSVDLAISGTVNPNVVDGNSGGPVTASFQISQKGPDTAINAVVKLSVSSNFTFGSVTPPAGWTCGGLVAGEVTCTRASWPVDPPNTFPVIDMVVNVPAGTGTQSIFTLVGAVSSDTPELQPNDNVTLAGPIVITPGPGAPALQVATAFPTAVIETESFLPANQAVDPGETVTAKLCLGNANFNTDSTNTVGTLRSTNNVTSPLGSQNYGTVQHRVNDSQGPPVCKSVTFTGNPAVACGTRLVPSLDVVADPNATSYATVVFPAMTMGVFANNVYTCSAPAVPGSDVSGTKVVSGTFSAGGTVTYTVTLTNSGTVQQLGANAGDEFVDVLPSELTLVGATATSGTASATVGTNTVAWNGDLAPLGGSTTITITATVNSGNSGALVSNQGTIKYDADANGTNEANRLTDDPGVAGASDPTVFEVPVIVSVNDAGAVEGGQVGFTVSLDAMSSQTVTVRVNTAGNTATANVDYNNIDSFFDVVIPPGSQSGPVNVPTFEDIACEGSEAFFINILSVTNGTVGDGQGVGTIADNEAVTTTTVGSSQNPSVYGQSVTFTATVSPAPASGTVTFKIDGVTTATVAVSGGQASYSTSTLTAGSHSVVADYSGAGGSCPSSGTLTQQVNKAATTTEITGDANDPSVVGEPVTVTFTVTANPPGAGTPTGIVTITMGGGAETCTGTLNGSGMGSCSITLVTAGPRVLVATYGGDSNFLTSSDTDPHQVNRALTTTAINTDTPDPSTIGEAVTVTYTVAVVGPGAGVPTGTVTVSAAGGAEFCTGGVSAAGTGSCQITLNSPGARNLTATYSGDASFQPSASTPATPHTVGVSISGTILEFSTNAPVANVSVTLSCTGGSDPQCGTSQMTNAGGGYTFANLTAGINYTVTPQTGTFTFDPVSRSYTNVVTNIANANFTAYGSGASANPRTLRLGNTYPAPGSPAAVPVLLNATGTERSVTITILYSTTPLGTPTIACGVSASGCTIGGVTNTPGSLTFTVTPSGAGTTFGAGLREIAKVTWPTFANSLSNTPLDITTTDIRDTGGNPLPVGAFDGLIIFAQGLEGDVAPVSTGDGKLLSNDPINARKFVTRELIPDPTTNEFMRVDAAPTFTRGNEIIDASDLVVIQNYVARNTALQGAGGAGEPTGPAPVVAPESFDESVTRRIGVGNAAATSGREVTLDVELNPQGGEVAASFTLSYDSSKLSNPRLVLGQEMPDGAVLTVNARESGKLGILVDAPETLANGDEARSLVRVTFDVAAGAAGTTRVAIDDSLATRGVSNREGDSLTTRYADGVISIDGALQSNVELSGRVLTPDGRGLRNTEVRITDASGTTRSTTTDSFGFYAFREIQPGQQITLRAISKTYRFDPRRMEVTDNLSNLDLTGRR